MSPEGQLIIANELVERFNSGNYEYRIKCQDPNDFTCVILGVSNVCSTRHHSCSTCPIFKPIKELPMRDSIKWAEECLNSINQEQEKELITIDTKASWRLASWIEI